MSVDYGAPLVGHARRLWLYLTVGTILFLLILPILIVIPMSFSDSRYLDFPPRVLSLRWYQNYLERPEWVDATLVSFKVAFLSCLLATPVGVAAAYGLHVSEWRLVKHLRIAILLPLMVPHIILAIGIYYVFSRLSLNATLLGLVATNAMLTAPFVIVTTLAGLRSFDMNQELVARSLGYGRFGAFMRVTLPQILGSVLSGSLFAFVMALDEVVIALFISGGDNVTLTKVMFISLRDEIDPTIAAISSLLIVTSLSVGALAAVLGRSHRR
jgi:putative spermidine/putrescine transport system permease protein